VQVEDLTYNLPLTVELNEIEEIRKAMACPVIRVDSDIGTGTNHLYTAYFCLDVFGRTIRVIPIEQALNRSAEEIVTDIPEDSRIVMERWLHCCALSRPSAINVKLDNLRDGIDFVNIRWN